MFTPNPTPRCVNILLYHIFLFDIIYKYNNKLLLVLQKCIQWLFFLPLFKLLIIC